jgi:hypothetical protein
MEEYLEAELMVGQLESIQLKDVESIKLAGELKNEYLMKVLDITLATSKKVTLKQYQAVRKFLGRQEMYDQGFTDKEIDMIEKKALKKQMAQI